MKGKQQILASSYVLYSPTLLRGVVLHIQNGYTAENVRLSCRPVLIAACLHHWTPRHPFFYRWCNSHIHQNQRIGRASNQNFEALMAVRILLFNADLPDISKTIELDYCYYRDVFRAAILLGDGRAMRSTKWGSRGWSSITIRVTQRALNDDREWWP